MTTLATFLGCGSFTADTGRRVEIHAGVRMECISGGSTVGTARVIVRSTLTGETFRVNPILVEIGSLDIECECAP